MKIDTPKRTFIKSITWRIISVSITFVVAAALTHNTSIALSISLIDTVIKIAVFYVHERYWIGIKWGRKKHKKNKKKKLKNKEANVTFNDHELTD